MKVLRCALIALSIALLAPSIAQAATLISTASGNIDATGTWSVVDTAGTNAFLNSETANAALTTTPVASSTFTPAAESVTAIAVKLASVAASPSGTLTVKLANSTSPGSRECTLTVNVADLPGAAAATAEGGFVVLACSASPNGTDAYTITASTSVAAMVNLFSLATTNWSHLLVTSGTQSGGPAAGDKFYVEGKLTGAGTHSAYTVTVETTANTSFGNVANTLVDPSIGVGQFGALAFAAAASTNYAMQFAGPMVVYNGGAFTVGTSGTPIPSSSTATLSLNLTTIGDTGINIRNGGTFNTAGVPRTAGKNVTKTLLTAQATGASTSTLTVADDTGWLSGDQIVLAGTNHPTAGAQFQDEAKTLTSNATSSTLPLTAAVTNTHTASVISYTSASNGVAYNFPMQPAIILLTRNVVVQGTSQSITGYIYLQPNANGAMTWTRFKSLAGRTASTGQRGIEPDTGPGGSLSITFCAFTDTNDLTLYLAPTNISFGGTAGSPVNISNDVFYNVDMTTTINSQQWVVTVNAATINPYWVLDKLTFIRVDAGDNSGGALHFTSYVGQVTNIDISSFGLVNTGGTAITMNSGSGSVIIGGGVNTWGPFFIYSGVELPLSIGGGGPVNGTLSGLYTWHTNYSIYQSHGPLTIDPYYSMGTQSDSFYAPMGGHFPVTLRNGFIANDSTVTPSLNAFVDDGEPEQLVYDNMEICPGSSVNALFTACNWGPVSACNDSPNNVQLFCTMQLIARNTSFLDPTTYPEIPEQWSYSKTSFVVDDCSSCTIKHSAWVAGGTLTYDTAISHSSGYSLRMTPNNLVFKGYAVGTVFNLTTNTNLSATFLGIPTGLPWITTASGFVPGTFFRDGQAVKATGPYNINLGQTVASSGSPATFIASQDGVNIPTLQSAPYNQGTHIAVASGQAASACVWIRPSISTDSGPTWSGGGGGVTYNADAPTLIVRYNPSMGVQADTVLATSSPTAGAWSQLCGTLPTAPADGEYEVVVSADQTYTSNAGGWVDIAEWSCTNCGNPNTSQFWWNGAPMDTVAPLGAAPGSHIIIGG